MLAYAATNKCGVSELHPPANYQLGISFGHSIPLSLPYGDLGILAIIAEMSDEERPPELARRRRGVGGYVHDGAFSHLQLASLRYNGYAVNIVKVKSLGRRDVL